MHEVLLFLQSIGPNMDYSSAVAVMHPVEYPSFTVCEHQKRPGFELVHKQFTSSTFFMKFNPQTLQIFQVILYQVSPDVASMLFYVTVRSPREVNVFSIAYPALPPQYWRKVQLHQLSLCYKGEKNHSGLFELLKTIILGRSKARMQKLCLEKDLFPT